MKNNDLIFDITDVDIDISLDKTERLKCFLDNKESGCYNRNIRANDTKIFMNFLSDEKLSSKVIAKVLR